MSEEEKDIAHRTPKMEPNAGAASENVMDKESSEFDKILNELPSIGYLFAATNMTLKVIDELCGFYGGVESCIPFLQLMFLKSFKFGINLGTRIAQYGERLRERILQFWN